MLTPPDVVNHDTEVRGMSWTVWRIEPDGRRMVVACVGDQAAIGEVIDNDRGWIDYEVNYEVRQDPDDPS